MIIRLEPCSTHLCSYGPNIVTHMPKITTTLAKSEKKHVEEQAKEEDISESAYIRGLVRDDMIEDDE